MGGLFLAPKPCLSGAPISRGNLIAIQEALFVQLGDAVSHLCKALHKLVEKS
jgi:hypothetical protein